MKKNNKYILATILTAFIFFHQLFIPSFKLFYTPDFFRSDVFHFNYCLKDFLSQSLKNNQLPLWTDNVNGGFPVLAESQIGTFNFSNIILFKFLPTAWAFNLTVMLIFATLFIGMFLFLRELNISHLPAFFSAFSFSFGSYFLTKITHLNHIQAASFMPLILYFLERYLENKIFKDLLWIAFFSSQQVFSGYPMMVFITLMLVGARIIFYLSLKKYKPVKVFSFLIPLAIAAVLTLGLSSVQLFPQLEYLEVSNLKEGFSSAEIDDYPYSLKNFARFIHPFILGNPTTGEYNHFNNGVFWESSSFIGIFAILLAVFSFFYLRKSRFIGYYWVIFFASLLLVLGTNSPLYFIFTFPPFKLFRVPARYLLISVFSLTTLCALFLEKLKKTAERNIINFAVICFTIITFWQFVNFFKSYHLLVDKNLLLSEPKSVSMLKNEKNFSKYFQIDGSYAWLSKFKKSWKNQKTYLFLKNYLLPNSSLIWNIASENLYVTQWPLRSIVLNQLLFDETMTNKTELLKMMGISHILSPKKIEKSGHTQVGYLNLGEEELYVQALADYKGKFTIINEYKVAKTVYDFKKYVSEPKFDSRKKAILEEELSVALNKNNNSAIKIIKDSNQYKELEVISDNECILLVDQLFYPGWKAEIDGKEQKIMRADFDQQAIVVPRGKHIVRMTFSPNSLKIGRLITIISFSVFILYFIFDYFKSLRG